MLSTAYPQFNTLEERVLSLVHDIGAVEPFALSHEENSRREEQARQWMRENWNRVVDENIVLSHEIEERWDNVTFFAEYGSITASVKFYVKDELIGKGSFDLNPEAASIHTCFFKSFREGQKIGQELAARIYWKAYEISQVLGLNTKFAHAYYTLSENEKREYDAGAGIDMKRKEREYAPFRKLGLSRQSFNGKLHLGNPVSEGRYFDHLAPLDEMVRTIGTNWGEMFYRDRFRSLASDEETDRRMAETDWAWVSRRINEHHTAILNSLLTKLLTVDALTDGMKNRIASALSGGLVESFLRDQIRKIDAARPLPGPSSQGSGVKNILSGFLLVVALGALLVAPRALGASEDVPALIPDRPPVEAVMPYEEVPAAIPERPTVEAVMPYAKDLRESKIQTARFVAYLREQGWNVIEWLPPDDVLRNKTPVLSEMRVGVVIHWTGMPGDVREKPLTILTGITNTHIKAGAAWAGYHIAVFSKNRTIAVMRPLSIEGAHSNALIEFPSRNFSHLGILVVHDKDSVNQEQLDALAAIGTFLREEFPAMSSVEKHHELCPLLSTKSMLGVASAFLGSKASVADGKRALVFRALPVKAASTVVKRPSVAAALPVPIALIMLDVSGLPVWVMILFMVSVAAFFLRPRSPGNRMILRSQTAPQDSMPAAMPPEKVAVEPRTIGKGRPDAAATFAGLETTAPRIEKTAAMPPLSDAA
jgi:hypothetical protein